MGGQITGDPREKVLETRSDNYIAKYKVYTPSDVSDFLPEFVYQYEACSGVTGTMLTRRGTQVTNEWCQALGCNYKQCVQKKWECNDPSAPTTTTIYNGDNYASPRRR